MANQRYEEAHRITAAVYQRLQECAMIWTD
jgi:hypothetical protein